MIPFIKSLAELKLLTDSRDQINKSDHRNIFNMITEDNAQRKRYIRSKEEKKVDLPDLPKETTHKWMKGKEAVAKFFDTLDYNNQIQSSYDLTLLERQKNYDHRNVA